MGNCHVLIGGNALQDEGLPAVRQPDPHVNDLNIPQTKVHNPRGPGPVAETEGDLTRTEESLRVTERSRLVDFDQGADSGSRFGRHLYGEPVPGLADVLQKQRGQLRLPLDEETHRVVRRG